MLYDTYLMSLRVGFGFMNVFQLWLYSMDPCLEARANSIKIK